MKLTPLEIIALLVTLAIGLTIYTCAGRYIDSQPERVMFQQYLADPVQAHIDKYGAGPHIASTAGMDKLVNKQLKPKCFESKGIK